MQETNRRIITVVAIMVLVFAVVYINGQGQVKESINKLEMEYSSFNVDSLSLLPPKIELTLTYTVMNPSEIPLIVKVDGEILYGETVITPITIEERSIPAYGNAEMDMHISLNGTLLQAIGNPDQGDGYQLEGTMFVTGRYLGFIPVTVNMDLKEFDNDNR
jgi:hypothetical protein